MIAETSFRDLKFSSQTAQELESPKKKTGKQSRLKSANRNARNKTANQDGGSADSNAVTMAGFDLPGERERTQFESDLLSLQVRIEYLLEEWLEFYRVHLGKSFFFILSLQLVKDFLIY